MGARGPRPKPTVLEDLHGRPGKRKQNPLEPKPGGNLFDAPSWMSKDQRAEWRYIVENSVSGLLTSVDRANLAEMVRFPAIWTFDNSATPDGADEVDVKMAPVDREKLRAIVGDALAEVEANDPATLKAEIARLLAELGKKPAAAAAPAEHQVRDARTAGWREGRDAGAAEARQMYGQRLKNVSGELVRLADVLLAQIPPLAPIDAPAPTPGITLRHEPYTPPPAARATKPPTEGVNGPMQRILDALAWWEAVGVNRPSKVQVAVVANYSPGGGAFNNPLGRLRSMGFVEPASDGTISLMALGRDAANAPGAPPTTAELHQRAMAILNGPQQRILAPLLACYRLQARSSIASDR